MTIFVSSITPQQPAFLYATYPAGTTVTDSPASSGYTPGDVLEAEEMNGWRPANMDGSHALIVNFPSAFQSEFFAIAGKDLDGVTVEIWGSRDGFATQSLLLPPQVLQGSIAAWGRYPSGVYYPAGYTSHKYIFSGFSSAFMIKHLACGVLAPFPYLADGACFAPLQAEGEHLVSYEGLLLGSVTQRVMRPFSLAFGQVTPVEEVVFADMVKACVATAQGLFFVPDLSQPEVYFGWIDKKFKYEPKMKNGQYTIPTIPFTSRAT